MAQAGRRSMRILAEKANARRGRRIREREHGRENKRQGGGEKRDGDLTATKQRNGNMARRRELLLLLHTGGTTARAEQGDCMSDEVEVGDGSDWPKTRPWAALKEAAHIL